MNVSAHFHLYLHCVKLSWKLVGLVTELMPCSGISTSIDLCWTVVAAFDNVYESNCDVRWKRGPCIRIMCGTFVDLIFFYPLSR